MKNIQCYIIFNTRWGYTLSPHYHNSVASAIREAEECKMAFRIFDMNGKFIKSGWYP